MPSRFIQFNEFQWVSPSSCHLVNQSLNPTNAPWIKHTGKQLISISADLLRNQIKIQPSSLTIIDHWHKSWSGHNLLCRFHIVHGIVDSCCFSIGSSITSRKILLTHVKFIIVSWYTGRRQVGHRKAPTTFAWRFHCAIQTAWNAWPHGKASTSPPSAPFMKSWQIAQIGLSSATTSGAIPSAGSCSAATGAGRGTGACASGIGGGLGGGGGTALGPGTTRGGAIGGASPPWFGAATAGGRLEGGALLWLAANISGTCLLLTGGRRRVTAMGKLAREVVMNVSSQPCSLAITSTASSHGLRGSLASISPKASCPCERRTRSWAFCNRISNSS